jgi:hypothetical protein
MAFICLAGQGQDVGLGAVEQVGRISSEIMRQYEAAH